MFSLFVVTGETNTGGYTVWVNGVRAHNNGSSNWIATNVPVNPGGTAVIQARAIQRSDHWSHHTDGEDAISAASFGNPSAAGAVDAESDTDKSSYLFVQTFMSNAGYSDIDLDDDGLLAGFGQFTINYNDGGESTESIHTTLDGDVGCATIQVTWPVTTPPFAGTETDTDCSFGGSTTNFPIEGLDFGWSFEQVQLSGEFSPPPDDYNFILNEHDKIQIVPMYFTGGKSVGQCIVSASVTASQVTAYPDSGTYYSPPVPTPPPIDLASLTVGDLGNPGGDGMVYKNEPQGATISVTVTGPVPSFSYTVEPVSHVPVIWANEIDLIDASPLTCCVGQQIIFTTSFVPPFDSPPTMTSRWTFPGQFVNAFIHSGRYASTDGFEDQSLLDVNSPTNWWTDKATGSVTAKLDLTFDNGQKTEVTGTGLLQIYRPTAQIIQEWVYGFPLVVWQQPWGPSGIGTGFGNLAGRLGVGYGVNQTESMQFQAGIWSGYPGSAAWVQLIDSFDCTGSVYIDGMRKNDYSGGGLLDNVDPFGPSGAVTPGLLPVAGGSSSTVYLYDSPSAPASGSTINLNQRFTDYLMFCPSGAGSIYVTLGTTVWSVNAGAVWPSDAISGSSASGPTGLQDSSQQPSWQHTLSNP